MTDLLSARIGEDDNLLPQQARGLGWYLAETGDLWELTEEGWYVNSNWVGKADEALVPESLQRLLTGTQWAQRVQTTTERNLGHGVPQAEQWIMQECMRDELFPQEDTWIETLPQNQRHPLPQELLASIGSQPEGAAAAPVFTDFAQTLPESEVAQTTAGDAYSEINEEKPRGFFRRLIG